MGFGPSKRLLQTTSATHNEVSEDEVSTDGATLVSEVEAFLRDASLVSA